MRTTPLVGSTTTSAPSGMAAVSSAIAFGNMFGSGSPPSNQPRVVGAPAASAAMLLDPNDARSPEGSATRWARHQPQGSCPGQVEDLSA
jgi:hypothetical protein